MSNAVVVFQSKYGSTKKYAQWIAEELSCELLERKKTKISDLEQYDTIIYGGGLYAGGVSGIDLLTKNFNTLADKTLILFTCGLADPTDSSNTDSIKESLNKVFSPAMKEKVKVFHLRGGIDYATLGIVHKSMMGMLHKMMLKKDPATLTGEETEMLDTYGKSVDFIDRTTIAPIVDYVREVR